MVSLENSSSVSINFTPLSIENLGSTTVHLTDILPCSLQQFLTQPSQPFTQRIYLNNGSSITLKCTVQLLPT